MPQPSPLGAPPSYSAIAARSSSTSPQLNIAQAPRVLSVVFATEIQRNSAFTHICGHCVRRRDFIAAGTKKLGWSRCLPMAQSGRNKHWPYALVWLLLPDSRFCLLTAFVLLLDRSAEPLVEAEANHNEDGREVLLALG